MFDSPKLPKESSSIFCLSIGCERDLCRDFDPFYGVCAPVNKNIPIILIDAPRTNLQNSIKYTHACVVSNNGDDIAKVRIQTVCPMGFHIGKNG